MGVEEMFTIGKDRMKNIIDSNKVFSALKNPNREQKFIFEDNGDVRVKEGSIVIQKFGGTSVSTEERRRQCANHIQRELKDGNKVVVVVSAMGRKGDTYATDTLLSLIGGIEKTKLSKKEQDWLLTTGEIISVNVMVQTLKEMNIQAIGMSGGEAGIITDEEFGNAKIVDLEPNYLNDCLKQYDVVVVAGFQGKTKNGSITTLGRGGSDTSATALGVALEAKRVDIFTDVEGVFTADPRIVKEARFIEHMTYEEIVNYAQMGAKVIHPRAVEMAMKKQIPIHIRSTFLESEGTLVTNHVNMELEEENKRIITGITSTTDLCLVKINEKEDETFPLELLNKIQEKKISLDFIQLSIYDASFTIPKHQLREMADILQDYNAEVTKGFSKISVVGTGMKGVPGVMARIVRYLTEENIKVYQTSDSHSTIWLLVEEEKMNLAINALHKGFNMEQ